jgi:DNA-directed RNA polymerase specialized sigma24 family protein
VPGTENDQRDDEERRFDALYQAYYRPILAYAVRRVTPAEDPADVVADVSTTAWRIDELPQAPADRLWRCTGWRSGSPPGAPGQPGGCPA